MKRLLLLLLLACVALPCLAQSPPPSRMKIRDPFAKPSTRVLQSVQVDPGPVDLQTVPVSAAPASEVMETHAMIIENEPPSQGEAAMWILGGLAGIGLIGAIAYMTLTPQEPVSRPVSVPRA